MALTYTESATLMQDGEFRGRIKVACLHYAVYIENEANTVPAHNTRVRWARDVMMQPDIQASNLQASVVMDDRVQANGAAVSDSDLQSAVEVTVNALL